MLALLESLAPFGYSFVSISKMGMTCGYWASSPAINFVRLLYVVYGVSFSAPASAIMIKTASSAKRTTLPPDAFQVLSTAFSFVVEFPRAEVNRSTARSTTDVVGHIGQRRTLVNGPHGC